MIVNMMDGISKDALVLYCERARANGSKIGVTFGCYDLFHHYHLLYLERCLRELGDNGVLIVGVDSDRLVKSVKGDTRPIFPEKHRISLVDCCKYVSASFVMNTVGDHEMMVDLVKPDYIFKNQDFDYVDVHTNGAHLMIIPDIEEDEIRSTTDFIEKIISFKKHKDPEPDIDLAGSIDSLEPLVYEVDVAAEEIR